MILIVSLMLIALLDSLNPSLFIAQFYLFTMPQPTPRIVSYIAGVLTANYIGGLLLLTGLGTVIANYIQEIPPAWGSLLQIGIGVALLLFTLLYHPEASPEPNISQHPRPRSSGLFAAFAFGIVIMGQELTTALPYFAAIERIVDAQLTPLHNLMALGLYNFIFALPLFGFLGLFIRYRHRFTAQIQRITIWLHVWTPRLMKTAAALIGIILIVSGIRQFVGV